ncbi:MAG TPA: Na+/H+ antiporter subunit E [Geminicoccaceae bacterium]|nr:Na+/H+ antiporter subunit E [Geminicoccaceae bacterium]
MPSTRWLLPHPLLSLSLLVLWLLLQNEVSAGHVALGGALALLIPLYTARFWPGRPTIRRPLLAVRFAFVVLWDIVVANVIVARLILFRRPESLRPHFLVIPLDARSPYAIAILAGTITMTPGTVSADLDRERRHLLVHGLDVDDPGEAILTIKRRYEAPLREIFG